MGKKKGKVILSVNEEGFLTADAKPEQLVGVCVMLIEELAGMAGVSYNEMLLDLLDPDDDVQVQVIIQGDINE